MFRRKRGLTLMEIVAVLVAVVLVTLLGFLLIRHWGKPGDGVSAVEATMESLGVALDEFRTDNGFYPTTSQGLEALRTKPVSPPVPKNYRTVGYILGARPPLDPWANPYRYLCPGTQNKNGFDLWSMGPDGRSGTEDDIVNWRERE